MPHRSRCRRPLRHRRRPAGATTGGPAAVRPPAWPPARTRAADASRCRTCRRPRAR